MKASFSNWALIMGALTALRVTLQSCQTHSLSSPSKASGNTYQQTWSQLGRPCYAAEALGAYDGNPD
jgi:hypothetical protein